MIIQPNQNQIRRIGRTRAYSGPGFGSRAFECLGLGLGLSLSSSSCPKPTPKNLVTSQSLLLWLRADLGATAGATFTLADQSGTGHDATATLTARPTITAVDATLSGLQTISFDGVANTLFTTLALTPPYWIFSIFKIRTWVLNSDIYGDKTALCAMLYMAGTSPNAQQHNGTNANGTTGAAVGVWTRGRDKRTNSLLDSLRLGAAQTGPGVIGAGGNTGTGFALASWGLANFGAIDFREIAIYSGEPMSAELAALDQYAVGQSSAIAI